MDTKKVSDRDWWEVVWTPTDRPTHPPTPLPKTFHALIDSLGTSVGPTHGWPVCPQVRPTNSGGGGLGMDNRHAHVLSRLQVRKVAARCCNIHVPGSRWSDTELSAPGIVHCDLTLLAVCTNSVVLSAYYANASDIQYSCTGGGGYAQEKIRWERISGGKTALQSLKWGATIAMAATQHSTRNVLW